MPQKQVGAFSYGDFTWWMGVVKDVKDKKEMGRVKVEIYGYWDDVSKSDLFWAFVIQPTTSAAHDGYGISPCGLLVDSTVIGFFADGPQCQTPIVFGTLPAMVIEDAEEDTRYSSEPDCNRLAREKEEDTCIAKKREELEIGIDKALGKGNWDEKETMWKGEYPFNHVMETKSGHVVEFDDTEGAERINIWHMSGTTIEIHPEGEIVIKAKGDTFEIYEKEQNIYVKESKSVTVDKDEYLLVKKKRYMEVQDEEKQLFKKGRDTEVKESTKLLINKNRTEEVKVDQLITIGGTKNEIITGENMEANMANKNINVSGACNITCGGVLTLTASQIVLNGPTSGAPAPAPAPQSTPQAQPSTSSTSNKGPALI